MRNKKKGARRLLRDCLLMLNKVQNTRLTEELDSYMLASQIERYLTNNKKEKICKLYSH